MNLRAALLRSLTVLKKNGGLPKDVILRKTMLDECKGERFEELLAAFAMIVLRKVIRDRGQAAGLRTSRALRGFHHDEDDSIALILAYKSSLRGNLDRRRELQSHAMEQHRQLNKMQESQSYRKAVVNKIEDGSVAPEARTNAMDALKAEWSGDSRWINTLIYGSTRQAGDLDSNVSNKAGSSPNHATVPEHDKMLYNLQQCLRHHHQWLEKWKTVEHSITPVGEHMNSAQNAEVTLPMHNEVKFDRHQALVPDPFSLANVTATPNSDQALPGQYARLLAQLNEGSSGASHRRQALEPDYPEYTPLSSSQITCNLPAEDVQESSFALSRIQSSPVARTCETIKGRPNPDPFEEKPPEFSWLDDSGGVSRNENLPNPDTTHNESLESLTQRTRKSMGALFSSEIDSSLVDEQHSSMYAEPFRVETVPKTLHRRGTLLDRTRQSMAVASSRQHGKSSSVSFKGPRSSQAYPVNQFGTSPARAETRSGFEFSPRRSPHGEKPCSDDADYDSIFKSRPKIAQSPLMSPERDAPDDGALAREMAILDVGSDPPIYFNR